MEKETMFEKVASWWKKVKYSIWVKTGIDLGGF